MAAKPGERFERYTHGHHTSVLRSHSWRNVDNSAAYLKADLVRGTSVIDVGCGPGTITVDIAQRVAPARVVGLDASPEVIDRATRHALGAGVDNVAFVVADAYALDFADDSFDVAHAHQTLQHVGNPVAVLREMSRVVTPGGIVAARDSDYGAMFWTPALPELDDWMGLYQTVGRGNGGEPDAGRYLRTWALAAGFTDVRCSGSMWVYGSDDERAWWGGMWAERILKSALAEQALTSGLADLDRLHRISDGWQRWAAEPSAWFGIPHGEILART